MENFFACGRCAHEHRQKTAPRYVSPGETAYPIALDQPCAECNEIGTKMTICLGCALERNQCQKCRADLFGAEAVLLERVRELRRHFNQSTAKSRNLGDAQLSADRALFKALCESAFILHEERRRLLSAIKNAVYPFNGCDSEKPPDMIETDFAFFALNQLGDEERQKIRTDHERNYESGRRTVARMLRRL